MSTSKSYIADVRSRYLKQLNEIGLADMESYQSEAFSRNIGLLSPGEQLEISTARVAIPGLGGVGGLHAMTLARCGITKFHLADFDQFEVANINRQ